MFSQPQMFEVLVTMTAALLIANFWSKWRYGFFDTSCGLVACIAAFGLPLLMAYFAPQIDNFWIVGFQVIGATLGCMIYDAGLFRPS